MTTRRFPPPWQVEQIPGRHLTSINVSAAATVEGARAKALTLVGEMPCSRSCFLPRLRPVSSPLFRFSLQIAPAEAANMRGMTCKEAAQLKYPDDGKMRRTWKRLCMSNWREHQG